MFLHALTILRERMRPKPLIFGVGALIFCFTQLRDLFEGRFHLNDFHSFYIGSLIFWEGGNPYDTAGLFTQTAEALGLSFSIGTGYSYPPLLAFVFWPFTLLSFQNAVLLFVTASTLLYVILTGLVLAKFKALSSFHFGLIVLFSFTYLPVQQTLVNGQANILLLALLSSYFLWFEHKPRLGILALVLASYLKVFPAIFFLRELTLGRFKRVLMGILFAALIALPIVAFSDLKLLQEYVFEFLPSLNGTPDTYYSNQSMTGFLSRVLAIPTDGIVITSDLFKMLIMSLTIGILVVLSWWSLRFDKSERRVQLLWLGVMILLAGKNSFWNFAPAVLIGIYSLAHWPRLLCLERGLLTISIVITNGLWLFSWTINNSYAYSTWGMSKVAFALGGSIGFVGLVLQIILLIRWLHRQPVLIQAETKAST